MSDQLLPQSDASRMEPGSPQLLLHGPAATGFSLAASSSRPWRVLPEKRIETPTGVIRHLRLESADQDTQALSHGKTVRHAFGWDSPIRDCACPRSGNRSSLVLCPLGGLSLSPFEHRGWWSRWRKRRRDRAARWAAVIAAYNESEARHLRALNVHPRIEVLPLGIDTRTYVEVAGLRTSLAPKRNARVILYLGPIHPREGLVPFLKAFAELGTDADGWNVVLAGRAESPWREIIEAAIQRKGGADRVRIQDDPEWAAQLSLLAQADILVCPALQHRCPTSIMQALASGVPVVATEPVALDGVGDAALVCRPSRDELRENLRAVLRMSEAERRACGARGLAWAQAHADWSVLMDRYVALYQSLV